MTLLSVQTLDQSSSPNAIVSNSRDYSLLATWLLKDDKLVCQWIVAEATKHKPVNLSVASMAATV